MLLEHLRCEVEVDGESGTLAEFPIILIVPVVLCWSFYSLSITPFTLLSIVEFLCVILVTNLLCLLPNSSLCQVLMTLPTLSLT